MTRFQKFQLLTSVIPIFSTILISGITYIKLKKLKARIKLLLAIFITFVIATFLNALLLQVNVPYLNLIIISISFTFLNFYLIQLQIKTEKGEQETQDKKQRTYFIDNFISRFLHHKKILIIGGLSLFIVILIIFLSWRISKGVKDIIHDANGVDNYNLNSISLEQIDATVQQDYIAFITGSGGDGKQSNIEDVQLKEVDYSETRFNAKSLNGVRIANILNTEKDNVTYTIDSSVKSGNCQIFIYVDNKLYCEAKINDVVQVEVRDITNKNVFVKVAGEDAEITLKVKRNIGDTLISSK